MDASRQLVATGQVARLPFVCVWDAASCAQLARLDHEEVRGICAVGFNADASRLVAVGMDNTHTVHVWDWRRRVLLATCKGHNALPPAVWGVVWNPNKALDQFVTFGRAPPARAPAPPPPSRHRR